MSVILAGGVPSGKGRRPTPRGPFSRPVCDIGGVDAAARFAKARGCSHVEISFDAVGKPRAYVFAGGVT